MSEAEDTKERVKRLGEIIREIEFNMTATVRGHAGPKLDTDIAQALYHYAGAYQILFHVWSQESLVDQVADSLRLSQAPLQQRTQDMLDNIFNQIRRKKN